MERSPLLVVGSVAIDWVQTPAGERVESVGGSATYFAMAASYFAPVRLVGVVGSDFPKATLETLRTRGVDLAGLEVVPDGKTFRWKGRYHEDMNHRDTLATELNVFESFSPAGSLEAYRDSEFVFLANIQPKLQRQVFDQLTGDRPRLVGLDTMNLWIDVARKDLENVLEVVDVLVINEEEIRQLTDEHNLVRAARAAQALGPGSVVVKRGEYGAILFHEGEIFVAPALPLDEVVDPTGAGDTFAGGFMGYLARGIEPRGVAIRTAMIYGSAMASFSVEAFSYDRLVGLDGAAIRGRFEQFSRLTNFAHAELR